MSLCPSVREHETKPPGSQSSPSPSCVHVTPKCCLWTEGTMPSICLTLVLFICFPTDYGHYSKVCPPSRVQSPASSHQEGAANPGALKWGSSLPVLPLGQSVAAFVLEEFPLSGQIGARRSRGPGSPGGCAHDDSPPRSVTAGWVGVPGWVREEAVDWREPAKNRDYNPLQEASSGPC